VGLPLLLTGCTPTDSVSFSTSNTRTASKVLAGATVSGSAYVFVPQSGGITSVAFFVDGATKPARTDSAAPFDLVGNGSTGAALPLDTTTMSAGTHRITVRIARGTSVTSLTSSFTVKPKLSIPPVQPFGRTAGRAWSPNSPFNTRIPANPVLDPNSASIAGYLAGGTRQQIANLYDYGWPVFHADAATPRTTVTTTKPWGPNPFAGIEVPLPPNFQANPGSDGHAIVVDHSTGRLFEFWQLRKVDGRWVASWGQVTPNVRSGLGNERLAGGSSKGAGTSGLGGLVLAREMRAGVIDHALVFASNAVTPNAFRFPATKTDGTNMAGVSLNLTIPEGARIRLDPTIDLAAIPGITKAELAVGRALQTYGAYCADQGGARLSFEFENPVGDAGGDPYPSAGLGWDYFHMSHIPWHKLQVLRSWDGR
jgi:hypothetical protein